MRTDAEIEAAMRPETQMAYIDALAHEMTTRLPSGLTWSGVRRALDRALGEAWVILPRSALAADAVAAPAAGVTVDREDLEYALDAWPSAIKTGGWWGPVDRDVFRRLLSALLTAQPADDAGEE